MKTPMPKWRKVKSFHHANIWHSLEKLRLKNESLRDTKINKLKKLYAGIESLLQWT